ncbi:ATPase [Burkholderia cepacia]|uniref:histidine kinase n=1 Tax=Burkholderia cepacia TaxID=292 RepID=A0A0J5WLV5_BURCE|nr:ATP-binding protein [Burkholderia cepacia]KML55644.1 ATPase [Burkholderia cepacia]
MFDHWIRSLSARLWLTSVAALALSLTLLASVVIYAFDHFPEQTLARHEQIEGVTDVANGIVFDAAGHPVSVRLSDERAWLFSVVRTELMYRVLDGQGHVLLASEGVRDGAPWVNDEWPRPVGETVGATIGGKAFDVVALPVRHGDSMYYAQTAMSKRLVDVMIGVKVKQIPAIVKVTILVATIIFGLTLTITVYRVLKPLREASNAAASITPRNLTTRLSLRGIPSEIKPLINAFNDALARLENGFAVQQQFLASAAHELQTPLTLIRGQIELQPGIDDKELLFREIDLMARQVRQLLHLAEVSESQNYTFEAVNCAEVMQDVVSYLERKADKKGVEIRLDVAVAPASIWADRGALFILLKNIVENAINISPPDSVVSLIVDNVSIQVRDEGPGIRQEYLPFLFKRFWRAPDTRHDGAGLGLAICKEIALAHEWRLTVSSLLPGTSFVVWL